jgi:hypothetical protein
LTEYIWWRLFQKCVVCTELNITFLLLLLGRYFCLWTTITPRRHHPLSHQWSILLLVDYYYSQKVSFTQSSVVNTSAWGVLLLPEGIIHPVISGRYFCLWTIITPRRYHPLSHQWSILLLVDYYYSHKVSSTQSSVVNTSACGLLLLPEGIIHPVISASELTLKLFGFPIFWLWTYLTNVILKMCRVH